VSTIYVLLYLLYISRNTHALQGAGTYMFRIDDERVIDATRAGSIAHLINHSCEVRNYVFVLQGLSSFCLKLKSLISQMLMTAHRHICTYGQLTNISSGYC